MTYVSALIIFCHRNYQKASSWVTVRVLEAVATPGCSLEIPGWRNKSYTHENNNIHNLYFVATFLY